MIDQLKDGSLSRYAFTCGYAESCTKGQIRVELYHEYGCYHIQAYNYDLPDCRLVWETTNSLTYARQQYHALRKLLDI